MRMTTKSGYAPASIDAFHLDRQRAWSAKTIEHIREGA